MKILIVDDNKDNLYFLESLLKNFGYEVISAVNGKDALEKLCDDDFNMIISDVLMPVMDGFQLLRSVKNDSKIKNIPFVFHTATYTDDQDKEFGLKLGAYEYLMKPIDPEELIQIIQAIFKDCESGKVKTIKPAIEDEEVYKNYSERLVRKLEHKLQELEKEVVERKQVEEKLIKLSAAVTQSPSVIVITDLEGNIEYVNPKFTELTGYSNKETLGENPRILKSGEQADEVYEKLWETISVGKEWRGELHNKKKNGELFWEDASISPIIDNDGKIINYLKVARDITENKEAEAVLIAALRKAEESDRLKSAFLANMSHEIRTPMNGILGFSELLKEPELTGEEQQEYISIIEKSGARMLNTINDLVEISKLEACQVNVSISEVNIQQQLEDLCSFFKPEVEKKGLQVICSDKLPESELIIKTDGTKLFGICANLVKNAIKYSDEGSIELGCKKKNNFIEFFVKDTGKGIAKDRHLAIFDRFVQADQGQARLYEGSGLGLSISKAYVELLGGKIWVESEEGEGSVFYFTIPLVG